MLIFYFSILLTIISNVMYHIFLKLSPQGSHPIITLLVTYSTALAVCVIYLVFFPPAEGWQSAFQKTNWTSAALGFSIFGLEFGFLLAYRAGWNISMAGIVSATAVAMMLIPVGLIVFKERLTPINIVGMALCIAGLILINIKA